MSSNNTRHSESITGLILCGGAGSRFGGADKGLLMFHGRRLIDQAIDRLTPQVHRLMINANRNLRDYESCGLPVIQDLGFQEHDARFDGPLAGILAGLRAMQSDWLVTVPCDCPLFPLDIVDQLWRARQDPDCGAFVSQHPTFALIPRSSAPMLTHFLQQGQRKLSDWLLASRCTAASIHDEVAFRNLNTPEDLLAETSLKKSWP